MNNNQKHAHKKLHHFRVKLRFERFTTLEAAETNQLAGTGRSPVFCTQIGQQNIVELMFRPSFNSVCLIFAVNFMHIKRIQR